MAGTIIADTLTHSTAGSVTTDYVVNGSSKAWHRGNIDGTVLRDSFNVSSLGDQSTGQQVINLVSSMNDTNYAGFQGMWTLNRSEPFLFDQATGSYKSYIFDEGNNNYSDTEQNSMIMGDLA